MDQPPRPGRLRVGEGAAVVQHVVAYQALAAFESQREDLRRVRVENVAQELRRGAGRRVVAPFDAARARGVAHVQRAVFGRKDRARPRRARFHALRDVGGNGHRVRTAQRAHVLRVGVAQRDVGDLVIEQAVRAARLGGPHAVQDEGADALLRSVVVAVGVPEQPLAGIGDEAARGFLRRHFERADAVLVGKRIGNKAGETDARPNPAGDVAVVDARQRAGVDDHVRQPAQAQQFRDLAVAKVARVAHFDDQVARPGAGSAPACARASAGRPAAGPARTGRRGGGDGRVQAGQIESRIRGHRTYRIDAAPRMPQRVAGSWREMRRPRRPTVGKSVEMKRFVATQRTSATPNGGVGAGTCTPNDFCGDTGVRR